MDRVLIFLDMLIGFLLGSYFWRADVEGKMFSAIMMIWFIALLTVSNSLLEELREEKFRDQLRRFFGEG